MRENRKPSPVNGQVLPEGKPFRTGDERAREAGKLSGKARREKADLRRQAQLWMEEDVAKDKDGKSITGAEMMIRIAVREIGNGNAKFWELMRDTAGYKPTDTVNIVSPDYSALEEAFEALEKSGDGK